jgi:hypothetical protein
MNLFLVIFNFCISFKSPQSASVQTACWRCVTRCSEIYHYISKSSRPTALFIYYNVGNMQAAKIGIQCATNSSIHQFTSKIQGVQSWRKRGFKRTSSSLFLRDHPALPRQRKCCRLVIPSCQFLYRHTFIRIL